MKAAVLSGFGEPPLLDEVPVPEIGADEVLIQVEACGVCHSGLHIAHGDTPAFKAITKPRLVLGHEVVGEVADLTKSVRALGGLHIAFVTSAAKAACDTALKCLRPGGTLAVVGLQPEALTFMPLALVGPELRIVAASVGTRDDMRAVLELAAAGQLHCEVETVPLASVNETHARMVRGSIRGRMVLRCC